MNDKHWTELSPEQLEQYHKWQESQKQDTSPMPNETTDRLNTFVKAELGNRTPVTMPREYIWGAAAGGIVLILTAWPVLILGVVLGAFGMYKIGCPCRNNESDRGK